jgi:hypothetical protein
MRFLLNSSSAVPKTAWSNISVTTKSIALPKPAATTTSTVGILATTSDASVAVTKKWGQQCGISCGCVLRFEIDLNEHDCVISAEYTAKRIVTTTTSMKQQRDGETAESIKKLSPILTNRTGRLQCLPSNCKALHQLSNSAIQFFINRPLWQLINFHDFQGSRSSLAFRQTVLATQNLIPSATSTMNQQPNQLHVSKKKSQQSQHHNHCFDLVEDAITALLRGYVPAPRRPEQTLTKHELWFDSLAQYEDEEFLPFIDKTFNKIDNAFVDSMPWHERSPHSLIQSQWWPFTWSASSDEQRDEYNMISSPTVQNNVKNTFLQWTSQRSSSCSKEGTNLNDDIRYRTALDWMDWFENDREKQQKQQQLLDQRKLLQTKKSILQTESLSFLSVTDWLTYVDALHFDNNTNNEQSA